MPNVSNCLKYLNCLIIAINQLGAMKIILNFLEEQQKEDLYQTGYIYHKTYTQSLLDDINVLLQHPQVILACDKCERKLNHSVSVLAVLSAGLRTDLCFTCFLKMLKQLSRKTVYYIRPNLHLTLTQDAWSILSQLILLKCLQRYSYGNWANIKNYMEFHGFNYTEEEIEKHYKTFYLCNNQEHSKQNKHSPLYFEHPTQIQKQKIYSLSLLPSSYNQSILQEEVYKPIEAYNAKRQEYLFDYDPEAEDMINSLDFLQSDTTQEEQLKFKLLEAYNHRINERRKRQQFVTQHKLLTDQYRKNLLSSGLAKSQIRRKMSCFSRFMTYEESQNIVSYLTVQSSLSSTVNLLKQQRRRLHHPFFQNSYQNMKKIKQSKIKTLYKGDLKMHSIDTFGGKKRGQSVMTVDEMRKRLKQTQHWKDSMTITSLNDS